jgi:hypothetical protein
MDTKRQRASLNTSFIDPRIVKQFPELTIQNLQMLQALNPEQQREQLAVLGMEIDNVNLATSQEPQEHVYAEVQVRPHSAPVRSRDSSVQHEILRAERAEKTGLQKQVEVLQKQLNRLQLETRRQREQLARLSTPPPPLEIVQVGAGQQIPGQVPEAGNAAGNANIGGGEIPQEAAEGENPAQQQQGNVQGNANANANNAPPPPPLPAPRAGGNAGNLGNGNGGDGREPDEEYTDGETDEEGFYEVAPGQIRYNDDLIQQASLNTPVQGLSGVLTHLSKPINVALSRRYRDDPEHVLRARKHMSKITQDYVQEALGKEHVIVQQ